MFQRRIVKSLFLVLGHCLRDLKTLVKGTLTEVIRGRLSGQPGLKVRTEEVKSPIQMGSRPQLLSCQLGGPYEKEVYPYSPSCPFPSSFLCLSGVGLCLRYVASAHHRKQSHKAKSWADPSFRTYGPHLTRTPFAVALNSCKMKAPSLPFQRGGHFVPGICLRTAEGWGPGVCFRPVVEMESRP